MIGHYIPPRDFPPVIKEFIEPVDNASFIWWLFKYKCVMCKKPASEINEIIPRSRSKKALDWRNRVTLCHNCHTQFHQTGVTKKKQEAMEQSRKEFLVSMGRGKYV